MGPPEPTSSWNGITPVPFHGAGCIVYTKREGNVGILSEGKSPTRGPATLKGRPSSFIPLLPAFIPMLTFLLFPLTFDFFFLALHIPFGSHFVPFLSSNSAFIVSRLLRWQLLFLHLDQSPQPHPTLCPAGLSWTSLSVPW